MEDVSDALNRLALRLDTLERRVEALEHPSVFPLEIPALPSIPSQEMQAGETLPVAPAGGVMSAIGKAMLGIAGAYLLRAVAESTSLPKSGIAAIAILYAILWLVWATRAQAGAWVASFIYACTSSLILAPMLWELTLRFKVWPAAATACVLGAFVCVATALAWRRNLKVVLWVANVAAALTALALSYGTHEMMPFIALLLSMALLGEYAAVRNHGLGIRPLVAAAADMAILVLLFTYSSPQSEHLDYPFLGSAALLAPGFLLFVIYGVSVVLRTMLFQKNIGAFETVQTVIAFLLAAASLLSFDHPSGAIFLGVFCLGLSAASYAAVYVLFDRLSERSNSRVFATWSAALFLLGSVVCIPSFWLAPWLAVSSIAATVLGVHLKRLTYEFHGAAYLIAAGIASGLLDFAFRSFAGNLPGAPGLGVWVVTACAVACYAVQKPFQEETWHRRLFRLVSASLASCGIASLLVQGLVRLISLRVNLGDHHIAFLRTLTICMIALALAQSGWLWRRMELTRIGYATLGLAAAKLVFEDLRLGHLGFIAASIFIFAVTLIVTSGIARGGQRV